MSSSTDTLAAPPPRTTAASPDSQPHPHPHFTVDPPPAQQHALHTSQTRSSASTRRPSLPEGCSYASKPLPLPSSPLPTAAPTVIWVDFPASSPLNPHFFSRRRKAGIMAMAMFYTHIAAFQVGAFTIGFPSMKRELGMSDLQAAAGVALFGWGFGIGPLVLAPMTEEFGRYWFFLGAMLCYGIFHLLGALGQNVETVLIGRFLMGICGSFGATIVAGTVSDIYPPNKRGLPMSIFTFFVVAGPGTAGVTMSFVEANPHLGWRWIQWIQLIAIGLYLPFAYCILTETRAPVILRRRAAKLRKERGMADGGVYMSRGEVNKPAFAKKMKTSLSRPLMFLFLEPIVTFFAIWAALVWGAFFVQVAGLPYVFKTVHGFGVIQSGLTFASIIVGGLVGTATNFIQDAIYRRRAAKDGVEARLYGAMMAGIVFALSCMMFGLTSIPSVHWIWPCIAVSLIVASGYTVYQACFVYLAECYGTHASSAVAGMSFLRVLVGSAFALFTQNMFESLTIRWGLFLMGGIAVPLASVPFVAFYFGPWIRARSPYSLRLMEEERKRVEAEKHAAQGDERHVDEEKEGDRVRETAV